MAKRGRKPKEKKDYFSDVEENAVVEYINLSKESSGCTCRMLEITFGCTPEGLSELCSGRNISDILQLADEMEIVDDKDKAEIASLKRQINSIETTKNKLYNDVLHAPFVKMIESIIRRYKLYVPDEEFSQTFNDTISHLFTKIYNFNPDKGTKAYSYCGTVCRNYLTYKNVQFTKEQLRSTSFDEHVEELSDRVHYSLFSDDYSKLAKKLIQRSSSEIKKMVSDPELHQLNENEVKVGMALVELLDDWEDLLLNSDTISDDNSDKFDKCSNKLQKSRVLYFLREATMMNTKEVRDNMKKFKTIYGLIKKSEIENL